MNKKYFIALTVAGFLVASLVSAQNQAVLPNAGLTPESPLYFLDRFGEALLEFFTFNPEGKARLQITFAAERVAEIKVILETKGVEAKGLEVAQARLQEHLGDAAEIVIKQKGKGKDVSKLAKELDDELETPKSALADSFKAEKRALETKEDELKAQLKAAHIAGDTAKEEALAQELGQVKAQLELLELKEEDIEDELEAEEEKIEEETEAQHKAEKAIREAEEEKEDLIDEAAEEGVELPANAFAEFDSLLAQAKSALQANNFVEAKNLAKRAEKSLDQLEKTIEELEEKQEKKEEAEEAIKEAEEEISELEKKIQKAGPPSEQASKHLVSAKEHLAAAKKAFGEQKYGEAFGQARSAEVLARNGIKVLEREMEDKDDDEDDDFSEDLSELDEKISKHAALLREKGITKDSNPKAYELLESAKQHLGFARDALAKKDFAGVKLHIGHVKGFLSDIARLIDSSGRNTGKSAPSSSAAVAIDENGNFSPSEVKIQKGGKVTWVNKSSRAVWPASTVHPAHLEYPGFDALRGLNAGESYSFVFEKVGEWSYHDHLNPGMRGKVKVVE